MILRRVEDLNPGDETPWYTVVEAPVVTGTKATVLVKHKDTGKTGHVTGFVHEEVSVIEANDR